MDERVHPLGQRCSVVPIQRLSFPVVVVGPKALTRTPTTVIEYWHDELLVDLGNFEKPYCVEGFPQSVASKHQEFP
jgi:hypothetical protein